MTRDELLKVLDLGGLEADPPPTATSALFDPGPPAGPPADDSSPTALEVDEWGLRRGRDLLADSERLAGLGLDEWAAADFHAAAFDPDPRPLPDCRDRDRHRFLTQLLETPEYRSLHALTRLDDAASAVAAVELAEQFCSMQPDGDPAGAKDPTEREMDTLRAVGRAVAKAGEGVGECRDVAAALGTGIGTGVGGTVDPAAVAGLYRRVRSDPKLRKICEAAGRYRRLAQSCQRRKCLHGADDLVGVEPGGDPARLLPSELVRLAVPELELDTLRRLAERQTLCRSYSSTEPVGKGPLVVCVDESGSMEGEKVHSAKAVALALAWVARRQNRWVALVAYSGDSGERLLAMPPGRRDEPALLDWLEGFLGRGSSLDVPVRELPGYYRDLKAPAGATDVVFLTDCRCRIPAPVQKTFLEWKRSANARLVTLVVSGEPGDLAAVSDEVHLVNSLSASEPAVERVLSI